MQTLPSVKQQIVDTLDELPQHGQEKVLAFARSLLLPAGIDGNELVEFFESFPLTPDEIQQMKQVLDELKSDAGA